MLRPLNADSNSCVGYGDSRGIFSLFYLGTPEHHFLRLLLLYFGFPLSPGHLGLSLIGPGNGEGVYDLMW